MFLQAIFRPGLELLEVPTRFGDADHRHGEVTVPQHRMECREDLFVSQVARGAKKTRASEWIEFMMRPSFFDTGG